MSQVNGNFDSAMLRSVVDPSTSAQTDLNALFSTQPLRILDITMVNDVSNGEVATVNDVNLVVCSDGGMYSSLVIVN